MSTNPLEAAHQLHTIRDWLRYAVSRFEEAGIFFGHGTQNSYDEAVWLVLSALHLPHDTLENFLDAVITEAERRKLVLITDCMSPVAGFEAAQRTFVREMQALGVAVATAAEVERELLANVA